MGHTKVRCKEPVKAVDDSFGGSGLVVLGGGGEDWNKGGGASSAEWESGPAEVSFVAGGW